MAQTNPMPGSLVPWKVSLPPWLEKWKSPTEQAPGLCLSVRQWPSNETQSVRGESMQGPDAVSVRLSWDAPCLDRGRTAPGWEVIPSFLSALFSILLRSCQNERVQKESCPWRKWGPINGDLLPEPKKSHRPQVSWLPTWGGFNHGLKWPITQAFQFFFLPTSLGQLWAQVIAWGVVLWPDSRAKF